LPANLIAIAIAHIVAIALVAIACPPPSLPALVAVAITLFLYATLIADATAHAAIALFDVCHPHSPLPLPPLRSLLLPSTSAACSGQLSLPASVVLWSSMLSCQPPHTFDAPVAS
jgi:hypothetical protein